jgi:hypothetical protein
MVKKEHRLRVLENIESRKIFPSKREIKDRENHGDQLSDTSTWVNVVCIITSWRARWVIYVAGIRTYSSAQQQGLVGKI